MQNKSSETNLKIGDVIDTLCSWLYPYSGTSDLYVKNLVDSIFQVLGSEYIRAFYKEPSRFFAFIESISTKYVGFEMLTAVLYAYEDVCREALKIKPIPTLTLDY